MDEQHDFLTKARDQLRDVKSQDDQVAATMDGLARKRDELRGRIEALESSIEVYRDVMGIEGEAKPQIGLFGDIPTGTIAEMAEAIIVGAGGTAHVRAIVDALADRGKIKGGGRSGYSTVYSILHRSARFQKAGEGTFTLAPRVQTNGQLPPSAQSRSAALD